MGAKILVRDEIMPCRYYVCFGENTLKGVCSFIML